MSVPKLRFNEFDGDWAGSKLGRLIGISSASRVFKEQWQESGVPFYRTSDVISIFKNKENEKAYISLELFEELAKKSGKIQKGDLLVTGGGTIGIPYLIPNNEPLYFKDADLLWLKSSGVIDGSFLYNFFISPKFREYLKSISHTGTISHFTIEQAKETPFKFPSKPEQTKIASFLSAVDEKISQLTQKHELLSQYKQGMMQKLFSQQIRFKADDGSEFGEWETKSIKDVADVKGGKRIPKGYALVNENTGHPYITVSDMNRSYSIDSTNIRYVPLEVVDTIKRYTITDKDIFISVAGTLGIIGKIPTEFNGANLTENADKLTNLKCHQNFLIYLLDSGYLSELIESTATTSAQPKLALYAIEQLEIHIPCLEEQTKIANFLSSIDQKTEVVAQQIEQAKQWKKGLLQQMFV
ncbi:hypothetical protein F901_00844 [Acinetobacter dispersus]|uniref:restriction endonuclease subunit S n=1 Tax=Acinetobacter dispersus TaxID=70348 RepID=UPI0002CE8B4D|nr:restriction endonuclease subunit S [Acinetobacter dispersus]ENX53578.1 hypothetical protein F901_00844 [Acinetobacter dispersus]